MMLRRTSLTSVCLAALLLSAPACEKSTGDKVDEAIEEVKDEAQDAKKAVEDEIDDVTTDG